MKYGVEPDPDYAFEFERFRVCVRRRKVFKDDEAINLGARAFNILLMLVQADGRLLTKHELLKRVWPTTTVEEHNIEVQISALRKALGDKGEIIQTEAGRGYRLAARVQMQREYATGLEEPCPPGTSGSAYEMDLSVPLSALFGRVKEVTSLTSLVARHRLVTVTGSGGIGKTRLAMEVAHHSASRFGGGVRTVELASITNAQQLNELIARTMGVANSLSETQQDQLLLLDNCEHLIDAVAMLVEGLLRSRTELHVLATSRECLAIEGERVYPLTPLSVPAADSIAASQALEYSAVGLFLDRTQAVDPDFIITDEIAPYVSKVCRKLDGIPLAIEFAAASAPAVGVRELARRLAQGFGLLRSGRRTPAERHKTLHSTFSWSYGLLSAIEQTTLRRVAVFAGGFTPEAAGSILADSIGSTVQVANVLEDLHKKSLVSVDTRTSPPRYRLLGTTRAFALQKLGDGEVAAILALMTRYYLNALTRDEQLWTATSLDEIGARFAPDIDNLRVALDWAFGSPETSRIGLDLTIAATSLWIAVSALEECRNYVQRALAWLLGQSSVDERHELLLQVALGTSTMWTKGPTKEAEDALLRAQELAEKLEDDEQKLRVYYALWLHRLRNSHYRASVEIAHKFVHAVELSDIAAGLAGQRIVAVNDHYFGNQSAARERLRGVLQQNDPVLHAQYVLRFGLDQNVAALVALSRVLWVQGFPNQAREIAARSVAKAQKLDHANSLCLALTGAGCGIAALTGDFERTEHLASALLDCAKTHGLGLWSGSGTTFKTWARAKSNEAHVGPDLLRESIEQWNVDLRHATFVSTFAEMLAAAGHVDEGRSVIHGILRASREEHWCTAEVLRVGGQIELVAGDSEEADAMFVRALEWARQRGQRAWELRAATSRARLWASKGQRSHAQNLLLPVFESFSEGFDTADLKSARLLLDELG
ncbi:winged helix-turn-helix domain-containing protein [Bradyrhizobium sp. 170]|uniref:ATP-binding protein n=1 Tax=Bradyrhizobium sp. 170 TaxID=2782641 RepID=UPI0020002752|nr:winged helix-turn-helix domain-containing protein [Bradyrhizobium sp. 170]UPK00881.1 winged helix-turn-helix domain-containing protein [Bradyrhizobium sp. 170]